MVASQIASWLQTSAGLNLLGIYIATGYLYALSSFGVYKPLDVYLLFRRFLHTLISPDLHA